jgi:hypothetical protein
MVAGKANDSPHQENANLGGHLMGLGGEGKWLRAKRASIVPCETRP